MDSLLFQRFKQTLDNPEIYKNEGKHVLLRKENATIPVILSAPHGGGDKHFPIGDHCMKPRLPGGRNVSMKADLYTLHMMASIDKYVHQLSGQFCYIVGSTVHRRYVDANRNSMELQDNAYNPECEESADYYNSYHANISSCIDDCKERHPSAKHVLLLDIHGQATYHDMIVLGTQNRKTCSNVFDSITNMHEVDIPLRGFIWHLQTLLGKATLPHPGDGDVTPYSGGHIVCKYGENAQEVKISPTNNQVSLAAVQLEYGSSLRSNPGLRDLTAISTAKAIVRSLWPLSCLGLRSLNSGVCICPLSDEVDNYKGDCDEYDSQLVSLQPLNKMLACETSQLEHEQLQHVLLRQGIDVPVHPWIHGMVSSGISLASPSPFGGGELGHTVVTRICYPVMPSKEINEDNSSEEIFGSVRGYVYDNKFGSQMVRCSDSEWKNSVKANESCGIHGKLVSYSSHEDLAQAQLRYEAEVCLSVEEQPLIEEGCPVNSFEEGRFKRNGWDICQVNVNKSGQRMVYYLAFIFLGNSVRLSHEE